VARLLSSDLQRGKWPTGSRGNRKNFYQYGRKLNCDLFNHIGLFQHRRRPDLESNLTVRERRERYFTKQFRPLSCGKIFAAARGVEPVEPDASGPEAPLASHDDALGKFLGKSAGITVWHAA
jgi:hypothetical protein